MSLLLLSQRIIEFKENIMRRPHYGYLITAVLFSFGTAIGIAGQSLASDTKVKFGKEPKQKLVDVKTAFGNAKVDARAVSLDIQFSSGKSGKDNVLILRDSKTGLIWWEHHWQRTHAAAVEASPEDLLKHYRIYLDTDSIVGFRLDGTRLYVRESKEKEPSVGDVQRKIGELFAKRIKKIHEDPDEDRREIQLLKALGRSFFAGTKLVAQWRPSKLVNIEKTASGWIIMLEGPDGENASVTLNLDFQVQGVKRAADTPKDK